MKPSPLSPRAQRLAAEHLELVTAIASTMRLRLPRHLDLNELESAGHLGLVEAASRFDRRLGVPFGAFARPRIRGAILEYLRQLDPLTRTQRRHVKEANGTFYDEQLEWFCPDLIEARTATPGADPAVLDAALVREAVNALEPRLRCVILRHYFEDGTLRSLKDELDVRFSRLSQLHSLALRELRSALVARGFADAPMN